MNFHNEKYRLWVETVVLKTWQAKQDEKNELEKKVRNLEAGIDKDKALLEKLGSIAAYTTFRDKYENKSLFDLVTNRNMVDRVIEKDGRMIRKYQPIYMKPTSRIGRAHLYAPTKQLGNLEIDTMWFNIVVIWLYTLVLYLTLRADLLRKLITFSETRKLTRNQPS